MKITTSLLTLSFCLSLGSIQAATIYSESIDGEISSTAGSPTSLGILSLGQSDVIGQIGSNARDYFTFTVAAGQTLDSITLVSGTGTNHFFGLDDQNTFSNSASDLLIAALFSGSVTESADFLDTYAGGGSFGGSGVVGSSLPSGDYTILMNETAGGAFDYQLRLTTVPEPSSVLLASLAGLIFLRRRRC